MNKFKVMALLIALSLLGADVLYTAWTTKRISNTAGASFNSAIAVCGSKIYVVWQDTTSGFHDIYFRKSANDGATWQSTQRLTYTPNGSINPAIAVYGSNIYVVCEDWTWGSPEICFRRSADGGATWGTAKRLTYNAGSSAGPAIAVNDKNIYVVWRDDTSGSGDIYFRKSSDSGVTWQAKKKIISNDLVSENPDIAVNGSSIYVVWSDFDLVSGLQEIYFRKSIDGGSTWQTKKRLTNNSSGSICPHIAVSGSNIYVVWEDTTPEIYKIYFRNSADDGMTWQAAQRLMDTLAESAGFPAMAARGSNIYVVWGSGTSGNAEIYFCKSIDSGSTWQTAQRLTNNVGDSYGPVMAVSGTNVYVAWQDETPGNLEIYLKYSPL